MSQENVELVRALSAPWERGDFSAAEWADPHIEFVIADGPTPGRWTGLAGLSEGWREFLSVWEVWRGTAEEYRELDAERVLGFFHFSARGKGSGLEIGDVWTRGAFLYQLRDGKVTRLVLYWDCENALEAVGLRE